MIVKQGAFLRVGQKGNGKMAVCSFIGHREIFDADIESKLQTAVDTLVKEYESIEFMIYPRDRFYHFCLLAVLRARTFNPEKVTIAIVLPISDEKHLKIPSSLAGFCVTLWKSCLSMNPGLVAANILAIVVLAIAGFIRGKKGDVNC